MVIEHGISQDHVTKHIFVTGGVVSSLGKGLTASSLGRLLRSRGLRVLQQKLDPYINVDPGTMNPFQHGEVYVTEDGAETDLDIGHYERFLDVPLSQKANVTTGQIYQSVLRKERAGEYLGQCVQVIPHITNEIKSRMRAQASDKVDVIITEIGGTVGDIESQPFLEAAREVRRELGETNCMFVHVSLVPYIASAHELKTKPTQHSVMSLRQLGIRPDALVLRSDRPLGKGIKDKISLMCDVDEEAVVNCVDCSSIYDIPKVLFDEGLDAYVVRKLELPFHDVDWAEWSDLLERVHHPKEEVSIAIVGKYIDLPDAYLSVTEALKAGGFGNWAKTNVLWIPADSCATMEGAERALGNVDGIVIPGGFGIRGIEGKIGALRWAREKKVPALGLCLGLQSMVIEYARDVLGIEDANSTEFAPDCEHPVIATMEEQKKYVEQGGDMGHTMRLGAYPAVLREGSLVAQLYGSTNVSERHRHRYEVNVDYKQSLEDAGLVISGTSPDGELTEFVELPQDVHPFYVGTQAHPEFKSRPTKPHPLFKGLVAAALEHKHEREAELTRQMQQEQQEEQAEKKENL
ncbi:CTP synthase [Pseudoscardovia suis]|uniref:CTP synthase n=1 Tax=Pseudoscardovia suis TaxID=987063 RepID=A0A261ERI7_9BIFI|nr:CTP synthase [Pseudoscardovia suis]OZG49464.1 CTP synthetase [Pseudoscardovia suis]PJJ69584.1 CTP synthase [Pseudoscardovia suis]